MTRKRVTKLKVERAMANGFTEEEAVNGYGFFASQIFGSKVQCIQKLDDLDYFESDHDAAVYASEKNKVEILGSLTQDNITEYYPATPENEKIVSPYLTAAGL